MAVHRTFKVAFEVTYGTSPVAGTTKDLRINSEGITPDRENMNLDPCVWDFMPMTQAIGKFKESGPIEMPTAVEMIGELLTTLFGTPTTAAVTATTYKHTFEPSNTGRSLTADLNRDAKVKRITGLFAKGWTIRIEAGKDIRSTFDMIGKMEYIESDFAPVFGTNIQSLHAKDVTLTIGGVSTCVRSMEFKVEGLVDEDNFCVGNDQGLAGIIREGYTVTMSMDLTFTSEAQMTRFYDGTLVSTQPGLVVTAFPILLTISGQLIEAGQTERLIINCPKCVYPNRAANMNAQDKIIENVSAGAHYDAGIGTGLRVELYNRTTTYA